MQVSKLTESTAKLYFEEIFRLEQQGEKFPVDLDGVWPLVYSRKDNAVRDLKSNFHENIDYQAILKNEDSSKGGKPQIDYIISVSCLEYFVVRKHRPVFEIYQEFRRQAQRGFVIPKQGDYSSAMRLAADYYDDKVEAEAKVIQLESKIDTLAPYVAYSRSVLGSVRSVSVAIMAKTIGIEGMGRNKMFKFLKSEGLIISSKEPYQKYINMGLFETVMSRRPGYRKDTWVDEPKIHVFQKGIGYVIKRLIQAGHTIPGLNDESIPPQALGL